MIKKKLVTKLKKLPKHKSSSAKKYRDDFDIEDDILHEDDQADHEDGSLDEFEQLQSIAHAPATLHHDDEEGASDEEEDEEIEEIETKSSDKPTSESADLTARGNKNKHYVKPDEFEFLIKDYYKKGVLTNDLCDCVYKIANRLSYRPNFVNYSFREEMVGDAIERMVFALSNRIYKYNPKKIGKNGKKGNAFLYFTKIAENAFINRIKIESRNREAITNYQEDVYRNLLQKGIDIGRNSDIIDN